MMPSGNSPGTPRQIVRSIQILFYAIAAGLIFFSILTFALTRGLEPEIKEKGIVKSQLMTILLLGTFAITMAERLYKKRISSAIQPELTLTEKLNIYRTALLMFLAVCEGIGLFAIILYFLTHNELFLAVVVIILAGMFFKQPKKSRIFNVLKLNSTEQLELN